MSSFPTVNRVVTVTPATIASSGHSGEAGIYEVKSHRKAGQDGPGKLEITVKNETLSNLSEIPIIGLFFSFLAWLFSSTVVVDAKVDGDAAEANHRLTHALDQLQRDGAVDEARQLRSIRRELDAIDLETRLQLGGFGKKAHDVLRKSHPSIPTGFRLRN